MDSLRVYGRFAGKDMDVVVEGPVEEVIGQIVERDEELISDLVATADRLWRFVEGEEQ